MNLTSVIEESFLKFGGAVLQSRALPDVRDLCKPSARQIFYCLYTDKFVHEKPFQKTLKAIGSAFKIYIHGDASAEGIIMRAGQPFAMRYPLVEIEGSYGTLLASGSWAAPRYTAARLSELANYLFADMQKNTIKEWRDNYDDTEKYPMVLPSKGFYNIVNGAYGIGVGASSSIPQYNLSEVNNALIKLLWNKDIDFNEIYCVPDFATGAILLNTEEVKESHRIGQGKACKIRSVIEFDAKDRSLIVTEIPYMVYTETICAQLEEIINSEDNPGIERFNDLTGVTPLIKIYLSKNCNPQKIIKYLYKNTSLQTHYGINFTVLENGRFPKVFTWKQLLQAHLDHEIEVYTCGFQYDLNKITKRLHIIDGLLKAISIIDEVIAEIKSSASTAAAAINLQSKFQFSEEQAKAILEIKLSRLAHLEISKLEKEKNNLEIEKTRIEAILQDENLLKAEIEKGLREVMTKFGDARRTKILNLTTENDETVEEKSLLVNLTNKNNLFVEETSSLYKTRRGSVGSKFKLEKDEYVISCSTIKNTDNLLFFSENGLYYTCSAIDFECGTKTAIETILSSNCGNIILMTPYTQSDQNKNVVFVTKNGYIKKTKISEYNTKRANGIKAIQLEENDKIVSTNIIDTENIGILTKHGNFIICTTQDIRAIGRVARGIKGIKLNADDKVVAAHLIDRYNTIISVTKNGLIKQSPREEFNISNRYTVGSKIQKTEDSEVVDFLPILDEKEIIVCTTKTQTKISVSEIPKLSRRAAGVKSVKITDNSVVGLMVK